MIVLDLTVKNCEHLEIIHHFLKQILNRKSSVVPDPGPRPNRYMVDLCRHPQASARCCSKHPLQTTVCFVSLNGLERQLKRWCYEWHPVGQQGNPFAFLKMPFSYFVTFKISITEETLTYCLFLDFLVHRSILKSLMKLANTFRTYLKEKILCMWYIY